MGPLLQKAPEYTILSFDFRFLSNRDNKHFTDYSTYEISYEGVTLTFQLVLVDATMDCGPRSCINFADFVWENIKTFTFILYAILCVPLDTPTVLYFHHYRSTSDGWRTYRITSARTVSKIVPSREESSSPTVPSQILVNVMCVYVNHRPSVVWLHIRSSITH